MAIVATAPFGQTFIGAGEFELPVVNPQNAPGEIVYNDSPSFWQFPQGGDFIVALNISFVWQGSPGWIIWEAAGVRQYLLRYDAQAWVVHHGLIHFRANPGDTARLLAANEGNTLVNADPAASKLTIYKLH